MSKALRDRMADSLIESFPFGFEAMADDAITLVRDHLWQSFPCQCRTIEERRGCWTHSVNKALDGTGRGPARRRRPSGKENP